MREVIIKYKIFNYNDLSDELKGKAISETIKLYFEAYKYWEIGGVATWNGIDLRYKQTPNIRLALDKYETEFSQFCNNKIFLFGAHHKLDIFEKCFLKIAEQDIIKICKNREYGEDDFIFS